MLKKMRSTTIIRQFFTQISDQDFTKFGFDLFLGLIILYLSVKIIYKLQASLLMLQL